VTDHVTPEESIQHEQEQGGPIDPRTGEYRQDLAEKTADRTIKSGVQINIDDTNAAEEKLRKIQEAQGGDLPNSFDKTQAGQEAHRRKYGVSKEQARENIAAEEEQRDAVTVQDTEPLNPQRRLQKRNQK
jgi:hypothetical protein